MNERSIFLEALEMDTPAQRSAYLAESCGADAAMRKRVEALLKSHDHAGSFLGKSAPQRLSENAAAAEGVQTQRESAADADGQEPLDFLAPSEKPDVLGRLGHYDALKVVGRGGMGIVLRAFDSKLHRVVAIKVMAAQLATNGTARKRFSREAQAAAAVSHDHIVTIHAVEEGNGLPYLVMQYVAGPSLQQRLDRDGALKLREILRIGMQVASGLAAAHAQGLVHRDIKPANILLENGIERVKITDFGLARAAADASFTQSGLVAGTPQFMSPEQARGEPLDHRTDLFSLGSVLYAMCAGRAPFRASGSMAVLKRVCEEMPRAIREVNPDIPDWLVGIIDKLQAKDPADRFQTAAEVAGLLSQCLAHVQQPSVVAPPTLQRKAEFTTRRQVSQARAAKARPRPQRRPWAVATVGLVGLLAGLLLTEATGITDLRTAVTHIFAPDDTKVHPEGTEAKGAEFKVGLVRKHRWFGRYAYSCAFSPDSRFYVATGCVDPGPNTLRVWEVATGSLVMEAEGNESAVFTPDSKHLLAAGPDKQIHLWELATGKELRQFGEHPDWIRKLELSADGKLVLSSCNDGALRLWDAASGKQISKLEGNDQQGSGCFSPNGKQIASSGSDGTMRLWDVLQAKEIRQWQSPKKKLAAFMPQFSADGQQILSLAEDAVYVWETAGAKEPQEFDLLGQWGACGFSADGRRLLYAMDSDTTVHLLELPGGKESASFEVPSPPRGYMSFSPDGHYAAGASAKGWVYLWRLPDPPVPAEK